MADDVKVKFSGDFSDVPKGAEKAANTAGSLLQNQFQSIATSVTSWLGGMFAATAIFDKLKEGLQGAKEYFSELNHAIRTTAGGGEEFQRVAGLGKTVGVGMETVARSVGLFSKYIGLASKDVKGHGKVLGELGFTTEQISSGNLTATQVLAALAKQLEETGNESLVAANASIIFGKAGRELMPIIAKGSSAITEQSAALKVYSDAELQAAEAAERASERRMGAWKKFFRFLQLQMDEMETKSIVGDTLNDVADRLTRSGVNIADKGEGAKKYEEEVIKDLKAKGVGYDAQAVGAKAYMRQLLSTPGLTAEVRGGIVEQITSLVTAIEKASEAAKTVIPGAGSAAASPALVASSLQAIGGGDIASIFSGTYQDTMLAQTTRIADATTKTAENTVPTPFQQPRPMPATK